MSRPDYDIVETYTGTGLLTDYTFDFKIEAEEHLLVVVLDTNGDEIERVRGDDTVYLSGVVFDEINGGGTVTLTDELESGYTIYLILANDEPTQSYEFSDKGSFTLKTFEMALDFIMGAVQRATWLAQRSLRLHDTFDNSPEVFDMQLPVDLSDCADKLVLMNSTGTGFAPVSDWPDAGNIAAAEASAAAAVAAAASLGIPQISGTRAAPTAITGAGGITASATDYRRIIFVQGSGGPVTVVANPQVSAGTLVGQELIIQGRSDTNTVTLANGTGLSLNGNITLGDDDVLTLHWDGTYWQENSRRQ